MKPSAKLARAAGAAFIVLCVLAYGTWVFQAKLNQLRAFEVPSEVVETVDAEGAPFFHLKRDPSITRNEIEMARLEDEIFIFQIATMLSGLLALFIPFVVMGKMGR